MITFEYKFKLLTLKGLAMFMMLFKCQKNKFLVLKHLKKSYARAFFIVKVFTKYNLKLRPS